MPSRILDPSSSNPAWSYPERVTFPARGKAGGGLVFAQCRITTPTKQGMKKCPFCAEEVQDAAVKCKHCQSVLDDSSKGASLAHNNTGNNIIRYLVIAILVTFYMGAIILSPIVACLLMLGIIWFVGKGENVTARLKNWKGHKTRLALSVLAIIGSIFSQYAASYPAPTIEITSGIENQGESVVYTLQFHTTEATSVSVNGQAVAGTDDESYSVPVNLETPATEIAIVASNGYKTAKKELTIERDMTADEKATAKALVDKLEAERRAWDESEAGEICAKYPSLTHEECTDASLGRYYIGMKKIVLFAGWGAPDSSRPSNYGGGTQWQWCWMSRTPSCFYDNDDDGIIDSYN